VKPAEAVTNKPLFGGDTSSTPTKPAFGGFGTGGAKPAFGGFGTGAKDAKPGLGGFGAGSAKPLSGGFGGGDAKPALGGFGSGSKPAFSQAAPAAGFGFAKPSAPVTFG